MCRVSFLYLPASFLVILFGVLSDPVRLTADDLQTLGIPSAGYEPTASDPALKSTVTKDSKTDAVKTAPTKTKDKSKDEKTKAEKMKEAKAAKAREVVARQVSLGISPSQIELPAPSYEVLQTLLKLHNDFRIRKGLPPFKLHPKLTAAAQRYAQYSFHRGRFGHYVDGTSPPDRIDAEGVVHGAWAENMATGQPSPAAAVSAWLASSGHRKNILSEYAYVGFGNVGGVWVADFANLREPENAGHESVKESDRSENAPRPMALESSVAKQPAGRQPR